MPEETIPSTLFSRGRSGRLILTKVVLLNGVGSSGKSSIAKALQNTVSKPFLHVEMDAFLAMMPERYHNHPEGLSFEQHIENGKASTIAKTGVIAERTLTGMRHSVAAMAKAGNNLIVDDVLFGNTDTGDAPTLAEYRKLLRPFDFFLVAVFAPLDVLEERERLRGDRVPGLARWQYERVHEQMPYDFEVHTENASPQQCAEQIKVSLGL
ncbi:AAA family ATPase [Alisedimentitalea sp. MJ-SS2]|nr:AAA family ATPase [Alisedimentitalea sp. MJ-SS2]